MARKRKLKEILDYDASETSQYIDNKKPLRLEDLNLRLRQKNKKRAPNGKNQ